MMAELVVDLTGAGSSEDEDYCKRENSDKLLAQRLQEEEMRAHQTQAAGDVELADPTPDLVDSFRQFNALYFDGKLDSVVVRWSARMSLCAGTCKYDKRGGLCTISLSEKLLQFRPRSDFVDTLLHEMIHAYLFIVERNRDRDDHGPRFQQHMARINEAAGTSITVYHSFQNEVDYHRTHWWKCNGPCVKRPPYFGIVKRSMNRAPGPTDRWWIEHQRSCGGSYHKIKEPPGYLDKRKRKRDSDKMKGILSGAISDSASHEKVDKQDVKEKLREHWGKKTVTEISKPETSL